MYVSPAIRTGLPGYGQQAQARSFPPAASASEYKRSRGLGNEHGAFPRSCPTYNTSLLSVRFSFGRPLV